MKIVINRKNDISIDVPNINPHKDAQIMLVIFFEFIGLIIVLYVNVRKIEKNKKEKKYLK